MFELDEFQMQCPCCNHPIHDRLGHQDTYQCPACQRRFDVLRGQREDQAAFLEVVQAKEVHPLGLPRGSVRAIIALGLLGAACFLALSRGTLPESLLSLLLTIIGFYFGFRSGSSQLADRVHDPFVDRQAPLFLPPGVIRKLMILAVAIMATALAAHGPFWQSEVYLGFFFNIAGLVLGHVLERYVLGPAGGAAPIVKHCKALACLGVAALLGALFVTGQYADWPGMAILVLCGVVSFYYGSRG
jgi:hypothetical protein